MSLILVLVMAMSLAACAQPAAEEAAPVEEAAPAEEAVVEEAPALEWPEKEIKIVQPWSLGGGPDVITRQIASYSDKILGVPGDGATAILMGAFMLHGMVPGPSLFASQGNILYAIMLGLIVVNVFMYILGSGFTRFYAHITRIPYEVLAPIVLTFCIAGAFSTNNRIYDIYIILIFGIIAYFLRRMDFQLVPILLGIVLGPLAEKNFRRAMVISEGSFSIFFTRPISCAFIVIAIGSVLVFAYKNYRTRKRIKEAAKQQ